MLLLTLEITAFLVILSRNIDINYDNSYDTLQANISVAKDQAKNVRNTIIVRNVALRDIHIQPNFILLPFSRQAF